MPDIIQERIQRTQRYWYVDGLSEIAVGSVIAILALFYFLLGLAVTGSWTMLALGLGQPIIFILGWVISGKLVKLAKERITYPRTGYVAYPPRNPSNRFKKGVLSGVIAILMATLVTTLSAKLGENALPVICGAVLGAALVYLAGRFGLIRFYLLGAFTFLSGIVTAWLNLHDSFMTATFFGLFALGWLVSGIATLILYLRHTSPLPDETVE